MAKLTKTEEKIIARIKASVIGSTVTEGIREANAANKLLAKGIIRVKERYQTTFWSRHGNGRYAYSRPHYRTVRVLELAD